MNKFSIIGSGLYGALSAWHLSRQGYDVTVYERRSPGGNIFTSPVDDFHVHKYGPHIASNKKVWEHINYFGDFVPFVNSPMAVSNNRIFNLPFNMNTFHQIWGVVTPDEAKQRIQDELHPTKT